MFALQTQRVSFWSATQAKGGDRRSLLFICFISSHVVRRTDSSEKLVQLRLSRLFQSSKVCLDYGRVNPGDHRVHPRSTWFWTHVVRRQNLCEKLVQLLPRQQVAKCFVHGAKIVGHLQKRKTHIFMLITVGVFIRKSQLRKQTKTKIRRRQTKKRREESCARRADRWPPRGKRTRTACLC